MGTRLFVGNLAFDMKESELRELFSEGGAQVGEVKVVLDRDTGQSRGFGFVEMTSQQGATQAIQRLDGTDVRGRQLKVNEARERTGARG